MKIISCKQGSREWFAARAGVVTASEVSQLVNLKGEMRESKDGKDVSAGVYTYLYQKLAERWTGQPLFVGGSFAMQQGAIREDEPRRLYEFETGQKIEEVGFITTNDGSMGCSPDGILSSEGVGFEIKSPQRHNHLSYLFEGELPNEYVQQVHASMLVTGFSLWYFISYCVGFPMFKHPVARNEDIIDNMRAAVENFNGRLEKAYARLLELNGGNEPIRDGIQTMPDVPRDALAEFLGETR